MRLCPQQHEEELLGRGVGEVLAVPGYVVPTHCIFLVGFSW